MPNSIALAQKYLPMLDEVYKAASKTAILDATGIPITGGNTVKVFKTAMDGLGNYNRNSGFVAGDVTGTWETLTLSKDRARSFVVDRMDNEETLDLSFGTLAGEFIRTKVAPEVDAYCFAKMAGASNILTATAANVVVGTTDVAGYIDEAERAMNEQEVPNEGRILFISETAYAALRANVSRYTLNGEGAIDKGIVTYNGMQVVRVPQNRFYTAITMQDGSSSGQTAGGYVGTPTTGYNINFLIVHPSAVCKVVKHELPRIFSPDINQAADGWKFDYRIYFDQFVYENKVKGVYLHRASTALS